MKSWGGKEEVKNVGNVEHDKTHKEKTTKLEIPNHNAGNTLKLKPWQFDSFA